MLHAICGDLLQVPALLSIFELAPNVGQRTILAHRNKFFSSAPAVPD
jgi:hypothetical protein